MREYSEDSFVVESLDVVEWLEYHEGELCEEGEL